MAVLAGPVGAETAPAACDEVVALVTGVVGDLVVPPQAAQDGWCVLDGARSSGEVRISTEALRVRGERLDDRLVALEVEGEGLRVAPALNNRDMPGWLRDLLRLQTAYVRVLLRRDDEADLLQVEHCDLTLGDGTRLSLMATVEGSELDPKTLPAGRVTDLHFEFRHNGRLFQPIMEALGNGVWENASGSRKTDFGRTRLLGVVGALNQGAVSEETAGELGRFVRSLPEARGLLVVNVSSEAGIGAAQLALLALAKDPTGPEALERFLAGTQVSASWTPGWTP